MDMIEQSMKQYERIRKGYPRLFSDAHKIAKLVIKASKKDFEPIKTWRYLQRLKQIESRKKGYSPVPDMVINIFFDAKLTRDEERAKIKQYYLDVLKVGQKDINEMSLLKEYIKTILEQESKLHPIKKGELADISTSDDIAKRVAGDVALMVNDIYGAMGAESNNTGEDVLKRFTNMGITDVDDDPEPDAAILYTNWGGSKKLSRVGHDGTGPGKEAVKQLMKKLLNEPGAWAEASGAPANVLISKYNLPTVNDEKTVRALLSGINDIEWHGKHPYGISYGDGWYTRTLPNGKKSTKIIVGNPPIKEVALIKEYISLIIEDIATKLAPAKKGDVVNVATNNDTAITVAPDVSDLVNKTYGGMGGFPGADTPEGVLNRFTDFYLSDVDEDPEPDAGILYTDWKGSKKASALVTDGGPESKTKLRDMMDTFFNQNGSWIEVSGAPANILVSKMGMPTIEDEETVRKLLPKIKDLIWHGKHPDGIAYGNGWYTRNIAGQDQTKIIVGNPPSV